MIQKWRDFLWGYGAGALITLTLLVHTAYVSGGFQRPYEAVDLLVLAAAYVLTAMFWPIQFVLLALYYVGVLPIPISL